MRHLCNDCGCEFTDEDYPDPAGRGCPDCSGHDFDDEVVAKSKATVDDLIAILKKRGLGWSLDHTDRLIEARVWDWPNVIGRYRPRMVEPLAVMLRAAMDDAGIKERNEQGK